MTDKPHETREKDPDIESLEELVDYLMDELDMERSEHVRKTGEMVADLQD